MVIKAVAQHLQSRFPDPWGKSALGLKQQGFSTAATISPADDTASQDGKGRK